jgi:pSer/pThr/pTyr-binding forkhead associated (FHA) protein
MREAARFEIQLIHIQGSLKGEISTFVEDQITIGRDHSCTVKFPPDEQGVSRNHATIQREGNQFRLIDSSKYGTFVNGKQADDATFLRSGDVLEIGPGGPKVSFFAEIVADAVESVQRPASPPMPEPIRQQPPVQVAPETQLKTPTYTVPLQPQPQLQQQPQPQHQPQQQTQQQLTPQPQAQSQPPPSMPAPRIDKVMMPLVIQFGPAIRSYSELPVVIGSNSNADFVLQFPGVSGQHLQLFYSHNAYWVKNLAGANIVTVNHEKIDTQVQLKPFDEIECCPGGPTFRFVGEGRLVEVEQDQTAPRSPQSPQPSAPDDSSTSKKEESGIFSKFLKGFKK